MWVVVEKSRPPSRHPWPSPSGTNIVVTRSCPSPPHSSPNGRPRMPEPRSSFHASWENSPRASRSMWPSLIVSQKGAMPSRSSCCSSVNMVTTVFPFLVCRRAGRVQRVHLVAAQGRGEHADQPQVAVWGGDQVVRVVLVERVHHARRDRVGVAGHVDDLALALHAVARFQVVAVLQLGLGARVHDGGGERVAHAVGGGQESAGKAVAPLDGLRLFNAADNHVGSPFPVVIPL